MRFQDWKAESYSFYQISYRLYLLTLVGDDTLFVENPTRLVRQHFKFFLIDIILFDLILLAKVILLNSLGYQNNLLVNVSEL